MCKLELTHDVFIRLREVGFRQRRCPSNENTGTLLRVTNKKLLFSTGKIKTALWATCVRYACLKRDGEVVGPQGARCCANALVSCQTKLHLAKVTFPATICSAEIIELTLHEATTNYCYSRKYSGVYSTSSAPHNSSYTALNRFYKWKYNALRTERLVYSTSICTILLKRNLRLLFRFHSTSSERHFKFAPGRTETNPSRFVDRWSQIAALKISAASRTEQV